MRPAREFFDPQRAIEFAHKKSTTDATGQMRVHLIDVGQGAAILLEFSCAAVLVDTGGESNDKFSSTDHLTSYLDAFFDSRPDLHRTLALLAITHPHIDHARGARAVWDHNIHIQNVVTNGQTSSSGGAQQAELIQLAQAAKIGEREIKVHDIPAGGLTDAVIDPVSCSDGDPDIRVLWGAVASSDVKWPKAVFDNANNHSVVIRVSLGDSSLLITGDLEKEGIDQLIKRHSGTDALDVDVYEVDHHGSANGTTQALVDAVTPRAALIAAGSPDRHEQWTAWAYGHPRQDAMNIVRAAVTEKRATPVNAMIATAVKHFVVQSITEAIYSTAWDGNVILTLKADGTESVTMSAHP